MLPVVLLLAVAAAPQDKAEREADMFGDASAPPEAPADEGGAAPSREEEMFGDATPTASTPDAAPAAPSIFESPDDFLDVGGALFLRQNAAWAEEASLGEVTLTAPSLLDAYLDVRPTDRVRGFAQLRLTYDWTIAPGDTDLFGREKVAFSILLDQAWIKLDLGRVAFVTAGRQRIRWGTGRFFNPTDFINQQTRDSLDFFDTRTGLDMLKVHFPFEQLGWNLYLLGIMGGVDTVDQSAFAARTEIVVGEMELSLSSLIRSEAPLKLGADASFGLWLFDLRAEGSLQRGLDVPRFEGELDFDEGKLPTEVETDDTWFFRGVVGGDIAIKYSDQDSVIVGGEYFYNQAGYDSAGFYPFLALNGAFTPFNLGEHYAAAYVALQGPLTWDEASFTLSTLANVSDLSVISRFDFSLLVLNYVTFNTFVAAHWGSVGEFHLGLEAPPLPNVPGLENGFVLPTQLLDAGVALRVAF